MSPVFDFRCPVCDSKLTDVFTKFDIYPDCPHCKTQMIKNFQTIRPLPIYEQNDSVDYNLTGHPIVYHTKGQLKEIAKQHGCSLWE